MRLPLHLVDAFADGPFTGNPAAVVRLDAARDEAWMQSLAMEMNQAETAFVRRLDDGWSLRWFTPRAEVDLCGHATLASAHALWHHHGETEPVLRFDTRSGVLTARRDDDAITLDFPAIASREADPMAELEAALGVRPVEVHRGRFDLMCVLEDAATLRALDPDLGAIARLDARGVIVTAPGDVDGIDFVSRFFAPALGVPEDPVTGSAHCALAPWWSARLGRDTLVGRQCSPRGGTVRCRLVGDRVELTGRAVTTLQAEVLA